MFKSFGRIVGALALVVLVGAGCAGANNASNNEGDSIVTETGPITLGWIAPLSGDAAIFGESNRKVVEIALKEINADGGVNGRELEVVFEDGKCNGKDASTAMQKLITDENIEVVIGGFCSGESLAAAPIANQNEVLLLSPGSSSPELTTAGGAYFVRNYPSDASQSVVLASAAYNDKGWNNVAIIQEQTDYAQALAESFVSELEALGGQTSIERFASTETDFRTMLVKLKSAEPDAIFILTQSLTPAELILKQMQELDWTEPGIIGAEAFTVTDLQQQFVDRLQGMLFAEFDYDPENEKFQSLEASYMDTYGEELVFKGSMQTVYDAVYMIRDAISEVGYDASAIRDWLLAVEGWEGASGVVSLDANGDRESGHVVKTINQNGEVVLYSNN